MCEPCKNLWMAHQGKRLKGEDTTKLYVILKDCVYEKHIQPILDSFHKDRYSESS